MTQATSLYFHIPFCVHRCAYCDFNTYAGQESSIPAYVEAMCREVELVGEKTSEPLPVHTVFFGGGTPSLLSSLQFKAIFDAIRSSYALAEDGEITMEANPGTISPAELRKLRDLGLNRISYGVQSANLEELRMLERVHDFFDVIEAVAAARKAGFDNLNLDLIYGLPEQKLETWQTTVKRALDLHPEHLSAYALTLEHGTPFGRWSARGLMASPDPDLAAEMYEWASELLEQSGYRQYEISNWARSGRECRHNLQYWRGLPYLAFGAGGHGYAGGYRYSNVLRIKTYIDRLTEKSASRLPFPLSPATVNQHRQTPQDDRGEFMMTGLRLTKEGVSASEFESRFDTRLMDVYEKEINGLQGNGLVEWEGERLRLTRRGRLLGNQVFMQFI
jgi:oxygen-independent coproporphyrinogen-3 oxidase